MNGGLVGATVGYNWQVGALVLGIEGDLSATSASGSTPCINPAFTCATKNPWLGTARLRVGYAFDRIMPYLTGGYAAGSVAARVTGAPGANEESYTRSGYAIGGGVEYAVSSNWSAKIEYLHVGLARHSYFLTSPAPTGAFPRSVPYSADIVRIGLNYRF